MKCLRYYKKYNMFRPRGKLLWLCHLRNVEPLQSSISSARELPKHWKWTSTQLPSQLFTVSSSKGNSFQNLRDEFGCFKPMTKHKRCCCACSYCGNTSITTSVEDSELTESVLNPEVSKSNVSGSLLDETHGRSPESEKHEALRAIHQILNKLKTDENNKCKVPTQEENDIENFDSNYLSDLSQNLKFIQHRPPTAFGFSAKEIENRFHKLTGLGFSDQEALLVAMKFPSYLSLDSPSLKNLVQLFKDYNFNVTKLIINHPYVLSLDLKVIAKTIEMLLSRGMTEKQIRDVAEVNPLILCFGLNKSSSRFLEYSFIEKKESFPDSVLMSAFDRCIGVNHPTGMHFEGAVSFLEQLQIPFLDILNKCPVFFDTEEKILNEVMSFLTGPPLFLEVETLQQFISDYPESYIKFGQKSTRDKLLLTQRLLDDDSLLYTVVIKSPVLFTESDVLNRRIQLLHKYGFETFQIAILLKKFPDLFCQTKQGSSLGAKLKFLLRSKPPDLTVDDIITFPYILVADVVTLKLRVGLVRKTDPNILTMKEYIPLSDIITWSDGDFATGICGISLQEYQNYVKSQSHDNKKTP